MQIGQKGFAVAILRLNIRDSASHIHWSADSKSVFSGARVVEERNATTGKNLTKDEDDFPTKGRLYQSSSPAWFSIDVLEGRVTGKGLQETAAQAEKI